MYKHKADSILETDDKRFISRSDKEKYDTYENKFILAEDAVIKEDFNKVIEKINTHAREFSGEFIAAENTDPGFVSDLEIYGNTIQPTEFIEVVPEMEDNAISTTTGVNFILAERARTKEFIAVECGDKLSFINDSEVESKHNKANLYFYDKEKNFISYQGFTANGEIPYGVEYVRYHHHSDYTVSKLCIERKRLDIFNSVGVDLEDGTYDLEIESCGRNLFDKEKFIQDLISINNKYIQFETVEGRECVEIHNSFYFRKIKLGRKFKSNTQYIIKWTSKFSRIIESQADTNPRNLYIASYYTDGTRTQTLTTFNTTTDFKEAFHVSEPNKSIDYVTISFGMGGAYFYIDLNSIQIEEYTGVTDNAPEPYVNSKVSVNLPIQLERVGNYSDRLFKRYDGVWCIEKNIQTCILNGTEVWVKDPQQNDITQLFSCDSILKNQYMRINNTDILSSEVPTRLNFREDIEGCYTNNQYLYLRIAKEKIGGNLSGNLSKYLSKNNMIVKYVVETPEIIELPLDTQITLNSFNGTTHIFTTNTDSSNPTIKCKAPVSLSASIASNINKLHDIDERIDKIESLENSSRIRYSSNRRTVNIEKSNNGVIDDIKIEGVTLVNKAINKYDTETEDEIVRAIEHITDGTYTFINNTEHDIHLIIHTTGGGWKKNIVIKVNSSPVITLDGETCVAYAAMKSYGYTLDNVSDIKLIILEGEHKDFRIPHFTGMKSTGETELNGLSLVSRNETGNVFPIQEDEFRFISTHESWHDLRGVRYMWKNIAAKSKTAFYLEGGYYNLSYGESGNIIYLQLVDVYDNFVLTANYGSYYMPEGFYILRVKVTEPNVECYIKDILLEKEEYYTGEYKQAEKTEKPLLYLDPVDNTYKQIPVLREFNNRVKDYIKKHEDGKWYYHKKCEQIELDGSEDEGWFKEKKEFTNCSIFGTNIRIPAKRVHANVKADRLPVAGVWENDVEGIMYYGTTNVNRLKINVSKTKLSSNTIEGFIEYLSKNPVNMIYELENEEIYEMAPLNLQTYSGETSVYLNTVKSIGNMEFTTNKYIGDQVTVLRDRALKIQEYVINRTIYQNRMMLNNMYNADKTSLKVDITTFSSSISESVEDNELYSLIRKNIIVGKTNYRRFEMEELIDFYTMVGKISFDRAEELFNMISQQYDVIEEF